MLSNKLIGGWTDQVMSEGLLILHVFEAVLADPQLGLLSVVLRKR